MTNYIRALIVMRRIYAIIWRMNHLFLNLKLFKKVVRQSNMQLMRIQLSSDSETRLLTQMVSNTKYSVLSTSYKVLEFN